jgi:inosine/xanthosine triphosphatase
MAMSEPAETHTSVRVAVGSANPVKIQAALVVFNRVWHHPVEVVSVPVASGVSDQPWGDGETLQGALNRAREARRLDAAAIGVGFEGGLLEVEGRIFTSAWCAVVRDDGTVGIGGGENMLLPPSVVNSLYAGIELGDAVDALTGAENTKEAGGAIGALTAGWLDRQSAYEHILILALAPLLAPDYFQARHQTGSASET